MNNIIKEQLNRLNNYNFYINNKQVTIIPDDFDSLIIKRQGDISADSIKIIFENYFIDKKFKDFTFHDKFNKGIIPYAKILYGEILKESEKMIYFKGHSDSSSEIWEGWIPRKSCIIAHL